MLRNARPAKLRAFPRLPWYDPLHCPSFNASIFLFSRLRDRVGIDGGGGRGAVAVVRVCGRRDGGTGRGVVAVVCVRGRRDGGAGRGVTAVVCGRRDGGTGRVAGVRVSGRRDVGA